MCIQLRCTAKVSVVKACLILFALLMQVIVLLFEPGLCTLRCVQGKLCTQ